MKSLQTLFFVKITLNKYLIVNREINANFFCKEGIENMKSLHTLFFVHILLNKYLIINREINANFFFQRRHRKRFKLLIPYS